jgi:putative membrane protein
MKGVVMMGYGYSGGAWMWVLGCLITVMLIVLVGLAGWAFATAMRSQRNEPVAQPSTPPNGERDRSRQVLDERYARGEMTTDEYNERRQTLTK